VHLVKRKMSHEILDILLLEQTHLQPGWVGLWLGSGRGARLGLRTLEGANHDCLEVIMDYIVFNTHTGVLLAVLRGPMSRTG